MAPKPVARLRLIASEKAGKSAKKGGSAEVKASPVSSAAKVPADKAGKTSSKKSGSAPDEQGDLF
jgi:hypothetical protein